MAHLHRIGFVHGEWGSNYEWLSGEVMQGTFMATFNVLWWTRPATFWLVFEQGPSEYDAGMLSDRMRRSGRRIHGVLLQRPYFTELRPSYTPCSVWLYRVAWEAVEEMDCRFCCLPSVDLPLRKQRGVNRMLIEHKASLSLEPERVAQGSEW